MIRKHTLPSLTGSWPELAALLMRGLQDPLERLLTRIVHQKPTAEMVASQALYCDCGIGLA
jgi:hypothetical protein